MGLRKSLHHCDSSKYLIAFITGACLLLFFILHKNVPSEKLHGRIRIMSQITTSTCVHCTASTTMKPTRSTSFCPLGRSEQQLLETSQLKCDVGAAPEHLHIPHKGKILCFLLHMVLFISFFNFGWPCLMLQLSFRSMCTTALFISLSFTVDLSCNEQPFRQTQMIGSLLLLLVNWPAIPSKPRCHSSAHWRH